MSGEQSWEIVGFEGGSVRNRVLLSRESNHRLAVLLPGYAYPAAAPLFHYGSQLLLSRGFDLLSIDYRYNEEEAYRTASDDRRRDWFTSDVRAVYDSVASRSSYREVLFYGKSMGTIAMLDIVQRRLPWRKTAFVWLTPATTNGALGSTLSARSLPSLVVIGSKDDFYRKTEIEQLSALGHVSTKVVEGADHGLEYPETPSRSVLVLAEILDAIDRFVAEVLPPG